MDFSPEDAERRGMNAAMVVPTLQKTALTLGRFGLLLLVLQVAVWPEIFTGLKSLCFRDYGFFGYPLAHLHRHAFWEGRIPHWNPYNDCGVPFLAQWNTLTLYPGSLMYLLAPLPWSLGWFCLAHQWLGGLGMFWLCRRWTSSASGAALAGVGFAFGGLAMSCVFWPNNIGALGWMPWVVGGLERVACEPVRPRVWVVACAFCSMQMLCGAPEITLMTWLAGVMLGLAKSEPRFWGKSVAKVAFAGVATVVLCAAQLLPFLGFMNISQRDRSFGGEEWSMPSLGAGNLVLPWFQSYQSIHGMPLQYAQYWIPTYYAGLVVCLAAGAGLVFRGKAFNLHQRALIVMVLGAVWLAMGDSGLLHKACKMIAPQLGWMRYSIKWIVLAAFAFPVLAAYGIESVNNLARGAAVRRLAIVCGLLLAVIVALASLDMLFPLGRSTLEHERQLLGSSLFHGFALVIGGLVLGWGSGKRLRGWAGLGWAVALCGIAVVDLTRAVPISGTHVAGEVYHEGLMDSPAKPRLGSGRAMLGREAILSYMRVNLPDPGATFLIKRSGLFANANLIDRVPKLDGFFSLQTRWTSELLEGLFARLDPSALPIVRFLAVTLWNRTSASWQPTAGVPDSWLGSASLVRVSDRLDDVLRSDWIPEKEAWIEPGWKSVERPLGASVVWKNVVFGEEHVRATIEVDHGDAAMATLAQSWHPGWQATVDGSPARVWRINHAFMGVIVSKGATEVVWRFRDPWFTAGAWISVAGWMVWFGWGAREFLKKQTGV